MKKILLFFILSMLMCHSIYSQEDRFSQLNEKNISDFVKPLATTLGTGINSATFYTADVPSTFGLSISFRGMIISVPDDQLTYTPDLPAGYSSSNTAPTFWGKKGGVSYLGPNGYISMPGGIDETSIPFLMPQISASLLGTEVLLRVLPVVKAGEEKISFFGVGVKHSISQYIPLIPVDVAVQFMYNKVSVSDIVKGTNILANAQASKSFGLFTAYGALQYESTKFDLNYTLKGDPNSGDPTLSKDRKIAAKVDGDNKFRFILGGAIKLAVIVINADINLSSQTVFTTGLSFEL